MCIFNRLRIFSLNRRCGIPILLNREIEIFLRYVEIIVWLEVTRKSLWALLDLQLQIRDNLATCDALHYNCLFLLLKIVTKWLLSLLLCSFAIALESVAFFNKENSTRQLFFKFLHKDNEDFWRNIQIELNELKKADHVNVLEKKFN